MTTYRLDPRVHPSWGTAGTLTVTNARDGRTHRVSPALLDFLAKLANPLTESEIRAQAPEIAEPELTDLLARLRDSGVLEVHDTAPAHSRGELTATELATHAATARGGVTTITSARELPPARLTHPESLRTVALENSNDAPSRSLQELLRTRRSIRDYADEPLDVERLAQLLDRACRVRCWLEPQRAQTTQRPSASGGARHSLEIYLLVRAVSGLPSGAYHYDPFAHSLEQLSVWHPDFDLLQRELICTPLQVDGPPQVSLYFAAWYRRVSCKYQGMTLSLVYRDTGCLLQTLYLTAADLGLAPCATAKIEEPISPEFLRPYRHELVHTGNFALGVPAEHEPHAPTTRPIGA